MSDSVETCGLCGLPMPDGEEMFKFHGYSGPCPRTTGAEAKPDPTPQKPDEIGWVIEDATGENGSPPLYWAGVGRWSYVDLDAIRFARQMDAERVASTIEVQARVAEHMWTHGPASDDRDGEG